MKALKRCSGGTPMWPRRRRRAVWQGSGPGRGVPGQRTLAVCERLPTQRLALLLLYRLRRRPDAPDGAGDLEVRVLFVPIAQVAIVDTWEVSGLAGTGSHDVVLEQVFVPAAYTGILEQARSPIARTSRGCCTAFRLSWPVPCRLEPWP